METFNLDDILRKRLDLLRGSLRRADAGEVRGFVDEIFAGRQSHPWFKPFHDLLDEHAQDTFVRAEVGDGISIVYAPAAHAGFWCKRGETLEAVGLLHGWGLERVKKLAADFLAASL